MGTPKLPSCCLHPSPGFLLAIPMYGPWYSASAMRNTLRSKDEFLYPLLGTWLVSQVLGSRRCRAESPRLALVVVPQEKSTSTSQVRTTSTLALLTLYTAPSSFPLPQFAELSNLLTHLILRSLRPASDPKRRAIPTGYGFDKITCPNYFFEMVAWLAFTVMTMNPFGE